MLHQPSAWVNAAIEKGVAIQKIEKVSQQELLEELILMGLRLKNGIDNQVFYKHFSKNISEIFELEKLQNLIKNNLIIISQDNIKITNQGLILANSIIEKVIAATHPL